jgi:hypothetical protein
VCYNLPVGILSTIFPRSFPRHDSVPEFISDAPQIEEVLKEIRGQLSHNKPFEINFKRSDDTRVSIDFTETKLNIDVFAPDGSFADSGVYPRKFNTALDVFNYTMTKLSKSEPLKLGQQETNRTQAKTLHEPLMDADSRSVESVLVSGQLANPKEVAQEGLLPKINLGEEEFTVKHLTNGRLLESKSRKIFLRNNNIHHYRLIDRLDAMIDRDSKPYGNPSELGQLMGVKGMVTTKAQPLYEADGVSLVKREKPIAATLAA